MLPHTNLQARLTIFGLERTTLRASMRSTAANMQLPRPPSGHSHCIDHSRFDFGFGVYPCIT